MKVQNAIIIGLGSIGKRHLRLLRKLKPDINISLLRSGKGGNVKEEKYADQIYYSINEVLKSNFDLAIISSPASFHINHAAEFMKSNINVLIEKPISHNTDDIHKLLDINNKSNAIGTVGYCLRYSPSAIEFKKKLQSNKIGKILNVSIDCGSYLPDWRPNRDYKDSVSAKEKLGGGVMLELSHDLDYIRWFFGDMKSVFSSLVNSGTLSLNIEDSADMIFESHDGYNINVHLDFNTKINRRVCSVRCVNGDLIWDAVLNEVIWREEGSSDNISTFSYDTDYKYSKQLEHFINCIENKISPNITLDDGVKVMNMIEAVKKSNLLKKKVLIF